MATLSEPLKQQRSDQQPGDQKPWYKQFWPWFIIALPASVVVAGFVTLFIAIKNEDSLVVDDYYKQGLGINRILAEDELAAQLHLQARLAVDLMVGEVFLTLRGDLDTHPDTLLLKWIHPTSSEKDLTVTLAKTSSSGYRGVLESALDGRWYVQLSGEAPAQWRMRTEINLDDSTTFDF